jgi:hypothetical protein
MGNKFVFTVLRSSFNEQVSDLQQLYQSISELYQQYY